MTREFKEDSRMSRPLVSDELWRLIEPLIPKRKPRPRGGRPLITDTMVLAGILFVLKSGVLWEMLPQKM
jgi:transposase